MSAVFPLLQNNNNPVVLISSLPKAIHLPTFNFGKLSNTVFFFPSDTVHSSPRGLLYKRIFKESLEFKKIFFPSIKTLSSLETLSPRIACLLFIKTRPSLIKSSAFLLEECPASAIAFCNLTVILNI